MNSRTKTILVILLLIVLGLLCGWFLRQWWVGTSPVSPVTDTGVPAPRPASHAGYCCTTPGQACIEAENPGVCFRSSGVFNTIQRNCDYYCLNSK